MDGIDVGAILSIISGIVSVLGALVVIYVAFFKLKPETKKINNEGDAAIAEASESLAAGTKISIEYWKEQISELREKDRMRAEQMLAMETRHAEEMRVINAQQIVTQRLIEEQRRELIAWQDWAKRLSHQVVSLGGQPVPFKLKNIEEYLDQDLDKHD